MGINSCLKIVGKSLKVWCEEPDAGGGGGGTGKERKERKDMLKAGQSRGSIVCVNGVIIKQCGS